MTGVSGFVAPRHLDAIQATGNRVVAAVDPHDAAGILDRYSFDVRFFTEFERFDRHLEKLRRGGDAERVRYLSICSPNYLHDAHIRLALRIGADAICEKPVVINPWNLDALEELERETGQRVHPVLQLREMPAVVALRERVRTARRRSDVSLVYITPRGRWYDVSWKGSEERSGGLITNIGVHLFDLLIWLFGPVVSSAVHIRTPSRAAGVLEFEGARVKWFLSRERADLPSNAAAPSVRSLTVDGQTFDLTGGFTDLHTAVYASVLRGDGLRIADARPGIELAYQVRHAAIEPAPSTASVPR